MQYAFINSGLERNRIAFILFKSFSWLMPISKLARQDGLLAIRRAFTQHELIEILNSNLNLHFKVVRTPLFRLKMTIFPIHKTLSL